ncbi:hypothetical protein AZJ39_10720 [Streptococcus pneumoniae]|uniref:Uncharacterized protein n=1 Tax=Streptococcus pneumoniae TaxID=1313 RepID=A0A5C8QUS1_STREE|nr:hypothetical protein AZK38_09230 [Streptococcus pneumoniae]TVV58391.1 hypothetical protein AZK37_03805 [Streptococcus pneumoniae]TVV89142.1 hypothetical protein AZK22_04245 [Streptococcus pneumoniae]TVV98494.1 hypothetical protein AZK15_08275 [Streptococcus pneumoniae]TVW27593.1 hypothetical protein AZK00_10990 [Streptococcus pneumoniae]
MEYSKFNLFYTLRKSLQSTSASLYRTQVQPAASFLIYSLIFIEYYLLANFFIQKEKPLLLRIAV